MKTYCVSCKKILQMKIQMLEKLNKIGECSYQIVLFVAKKSAFIKDKELHNFNLNKKIINKFLFTGDKFVFKLHLKKPRFTYSACRSFTKHRERF